MDRPISLRGCARLGAANAIAAWPRFVMLALLAAAIAAATSWAGPRALQQFLLSTAANRRNGGSVLVARSQHGLDGTTCDRLARVTGIARAGGLEPSPTLHALRPGALVSWWTMTPGFRALVLDGERGGPGPDGMLVGNALEVELGLGAGSRVARPLGGPGPTTVGVLPDRGARTESFARSALVLDARRHSYAQCWLEAGGATVRSATALLTSTFALTNPDVQVAPLVGDGGAGPPRPPSTVLTWAACGVLLGLANSLFCLLRRVDSALFGLLGMTFRQRAVAIGSELLLADVFGAAAAVLAVVGWMAEHGPLPRPTVAASSEFLVASAACCVLTTLLSLALVGARQWFSVLREG